MAEENQQSRQQVAIERIYIKDLSYEAPHDPGHYDFSGGWNPDMNVQLNTEARKIADDLYEVVLNVTVTVKVEDKAAFLVEIKQAGRFHIQGFDEKSLRAIQGSFCPNLLYPFAREEIANVVMKGGFPQTLLAPVNFDALYAQHLQQEQSMAEGQDTTASKH